MATPYTEDPDDEFDYSSDWAECVGDTQPGGGGHFTATAQEDVIAGLVPANKLRSAVRYFLGFAYADEGSPYALHREQPAVHPVWPMLRAYDAGYQKLSAKAASKFAIDPDTGDEVETVNTKTESPWAGAQGETLYYADYAMALLTVRFKSWGRMRFLADEAIGDYRDEYKRNFRILTEPSVEVLSADGSAQLKFADYTGPTVSIPAPVGELLGKIAMVGRWEAVPHEYVSSDPDILVPINTITTSGGSKIVTGILNCLGKVNSEPFLGQWAGTILLRAVKFEDVLYPVPSDDPVEGYPLAGYTVTLIWEFFDPPKGDTSVFPGHHGHNLMPYRSDGKFYYALRGDSLTPLIQSVDMWKVFQHILDPS